MFSQHPKSAFWSSKNTKTPNEVALNSHKKFWFDCDKCNHVFEIRLNSINQFNSWCGFCSNKKLCEDTECNLCFEKLRCRLGAATRNYTSTNASV